MEEQSLPYLERERQGTEIQRHRYDGGQFQLFLAQLRRFPGRADRPAEVDDAVHVLVAEVELADLAIADRKSQRRFKVLHITFAGDGGVKWVAILREVHLEVDLIRAEICIGLYVPAFRLFFLGLCGKHTWR